MNNAKIQRAVKFLETVARDVAPIKSARIAAGLYIQGRLIALGVNQNKTSPFQKRFARNEVCGALIHAEVDCIKNALKVVSVDELKNAEMVIVRVRYTDQEKRGQEFGMVRPCGGCFSCISVFEISQVYYTKDDQTIETLYCEEV